MRMGIGVVVSDRLARLPNLAAEMVAAGEAEAEVAMEATWGWYWAAGVIAECGARLYLAHPLGIAG